MKKRFKKQKKVDAFGRIYTFYEQLYDTKLSIRSKELDGISGGTEDIYKRPDDSSPWGQTGDGDKSDVPQVFIMG